MQSGSEPWIPDKQILEICHCRSEPILLTPIASCELAGGEARELTGPLAGTLASISMGAVYMGALTYIGNAPNYMVYAIAQQNGVRMPNFFAYMLWAAVALVPLFVLLTFLPIAPILKWS